MGSVDYQVAFKQVTEYLTLVGRNGIVLNSDKFSFGEDTVDWAGIRIGNDKVKPLPDHIRAIKEFPTPNNLTDMRSYWALVNQVSPYYCVQQHLQPFRELLKKKTQWYFAKELILYQICNYHTVTSTTASYQTYLVGTGTNQYIPCSLGYIGGRYENLGPLTILWPA